VSLQLGSLANVVSVATGDAVPCGGATCGAYLSVRSVVLDRDSKRVRGEAPSCSICSGTFYLLMCCGAQCGSSVTGLPSSHSAPLCRPGR
jgi:hypothetical protein